MKSVIAAAAKTDIGLVRTNNEDAFGYDVSAGIFVVCDGMGGHAAGEQASRIAVSTVLAHFRQPPQSSGVSLLGNNIGEVSRRANHLAHAILLANQAIRESCAHDPQQAGMGSTIVAVLVEGNEFSLGHVGDSRGYLVRDGSLHRLTTDHSLVVEQLRRGLITLEEAEHSKMQNVILRALGADESVDPDLADHEFVTGDVVLLCSDGLSRYITESAIADVIGRMQNLDEACDNLIESAKGGNSDDNITCLLLRFAGQSWGQRLVGRFGSRTTGAARTSWS